MKKYRKLILPVILLLAMLACNMGQAWHDATVDETSTPTITSTPTLTPTPVATNTPLPTSTPNGPAPAMISWLEVQGFVKDASHVPCQDPCFPYWANQIGVEIVVYPKGSTNIYMSLEGKYKGQDKSVVDNFLTKFYGTNVYQSALGLMTAASNGHIYGIPIKTDNVDGYDVEVEIMDALTWVVISVYPA